MKGTALLLALSLALCLAAGCGAPASTPNAPAAAPPASFAEILSEEQTAFLERAASEMPVYLTYYRDREEAQWYGTDDPAHIRACLDAIAAITVEAETQRITIGCDDCFSFMMADGAECTFAFNDGNFQQGNANIRLFTVKNTSALWELAGALCEQGQIAPPY